MNRKIGMSNPVRRTIGRRGRLSRMKTTMVTRMAASRSVVG